MSALWKSDWCETDDSSCGLCTQVSLKQSSYSTTRLNKHCSDISPKCLQHTQPRCFPQQCFNLTAAQELRCLQLGCLQSCCSLPSLEQTQGSKKLPGHWPWPQCRNTHELTRKGSQTPHVAAAISGTGRFLPGPETCSESCLWSSAAAGDNSLCTSVCPGEQWFCSAACTAGCQLTEKNSHIFSLPMHLPSPQATLQAAGRAQHHQLNNQAALPRQPFPQQGLLWLFTLWRPNFFPFTVSMSIFFHNMGDDYFFKQSTAPVTFCQCQYSQSTPTWALQHGKLGLLRVRLTASVNSSPLFSRRQGVIRSRQGFQVIQSISHPTFKLSLSPML